MDIIRRAGTPGDWTQAHALLHDYVEWIRAATDLDPLTEQPGFSAELDGLEQAYGGDEATLFVAYDGELAVGTVAVRFHDDGSAELKRMYVRPVARGRGLAARLIDEVLATATERGCHTVWLESLPGVMDPAIAIYRRHCFVELDERSRTVRSVDVVVMGRSLQRARRSA